MEGSHCKCVEPLGESWFDVDIIIQLCKAMGIPWSADPDDRGRTPSRSLMRHASRWVLPGRSGSQEFQKTGFRDCKKEYPDDWGTYRRYETGHCRSDGKPGLQTPHAQAGDMVDHHRDGTILTAGTTFPRIPSPRRVPLRSLSGLRSTPTS